MGESVLLEGLALGLNNPIIILTCSQVRPLKGPGTTGSQQPSGPIISQSKDMSLSCLHSAASFQETFPQVDLGCGNTALLLGRSKS